MFWLKHSLALTLNQFMADPNEQSSQMPTTEALDIISAVFPEFLQPITGATAVATFTRARMRGKVAVRDHTNACGIASDNTSPGGLADDVRREGTNTDNAAEENATHATEAPDPDPAA